MLEPGLEATVEERVTDAMTAERLGSGDVPVLGTPAVLALVEAAAVAAVAGSVGPGQATVGSAVELQHVAPTGIGRTVTATAGLIEAGACASRSRSPIRQARSLAEPTRVWSWIGTVSSKVPATGHDSRVQPR